MIFTKCNLSGVYIIKPEFLEDERGYFSRAFCKNEFLNTIGVDFECRQCNYSYNNNRGTLRGMHYQRVPYLEDKIVSCISGSIFDVVVDVRPDSSTYLQWEGVYLSDENRWSLFIPKGFAHGFVTLEDATCVYYQMSEFYHKGYEAGLRFNDPAIGIEWPYEGELIISERDLNFSLIGQEMI